MALGQDGGLGLDIAALSPPHWQTHASVGDGDADAMPATPMFELGRVQYALPAPLIQFAVASNKMVLCMHAAGSTDGTLLRLIWVDLDDPARTHEGLVPMPPTARAQPRATAQGSRLFVDPSAEHVLVWLTSGHMYYWTPVLARARLLPRLTGLALTAVAWGPAALTPRASLGAAPNGRRWVATPPILLATASGEVWEALCAVQVAAPAAPGPAPRADFFDRLARKTTGAHAEYTGAVERDVRRVFVLSDVQPIAGAVWVQPAATAYIVLATATRLYEFSGETGGGAGDSPSSALDAVFQPYRDTLQTHLKIELPSEHDAASLLSTTAGAATPNRRALVWHTGAGLYHAQVNLDAQVQHDFLEKAGLLTYEHSVPRFVARTAFHWVLVYADRIRCLHTLDESESWNAPLPLAPHEAVLGVSVDAVHHSCWVYTATSIFELIVTDEARDVWRIWLSRGVYDDALAYAPDDAARAKVLATQGDALLRAGRADDAAVVYAQTRERSFDTVVLALVAHDAHDALRTYVQRRLDGLPASEKTARLMLATWLVELYLGALDRAEDAATEAATDTAQDVAKDRAQHDIVLDSPPSLATLERGLRTLFSTYAKALDRTTTYALLARHGRDDMWLAYAEAIGDTRSIVARAIERAAYDEALRTLAAHDDVALYYDFSVPLMQHAPAATVACWKRHTGLDAVRLIPALLQHRAPPGAADVALDYLTHVAYEQHSEAVAVHNLLLTRLAARAADAAQPEAVRSTARDALQTCIEGQRTGGRVYFDLDYALRLCARHALHDPCVRLYARMERHENAVHLALEAGDVDLACRCAELAPNRDVRKKLWLQCAAQVIRAEHGVQDAMAFLQRTSLLTLEDVLPLFPDFVVIDGFQEEICEMLDAYVQRIDALKAEMDRTTHTADHIQREIGALATQFVHLDAGQPCETCGAPLLQRHMYLFPCHHGYHADCLTREVTQHLPPRRLRRLLQLQAELEAYAQPAADADGTSQSAAPNRAPGTAGAAGWSALRLDKLREHVRPQAIVDAISTGFSVGVASGRRVLAPLDPFAEPSGGARATQPAAAHAAADAAAQDAASLQMLADVDAVRSEMNAIVAGACPQCTLAVQQLAQPLIDGKDDDVAWVV
ncbi:hypothetical protein MBRA1_002881 [Malassezia brasiliensis]|uniref:Pep3/Vps18/deep orange domain-containing protein n=1 Tax=Malassezia brasiliensis TaxID=1821822 RepID=A0AAF0IQK6_9BASI|nr:hypothetical protein MBRA1_002881 [Malassezia brasiliensis]